MPKGRGSNHRRRGPRQMRAVGCIDGNGGASHCVGPDSGHRHFVGRLRWTPPSAIHASARRRPWWRRLWARVLELVTGSGIAQRRVEAERAQMMVRRDRAQALIDSKGSRAVTRVRQRR